MENNTMKRTRGSENKQGSTTTKYKPKFRLSITAWIMVAITVIIVVFLGIEFIQTASSKGTPVIGERPMAKQLSEEQVAKLDADIKAKYTNTDQIEVSYIANRLVVILDEKEGVTSTTAKNDVAGVYKIITSQFPVADYFSVVDGFQGNDITVYAFDSLESEKGPGYNIQLLKNSQMSKPSTSDLTKVRDSAAAKKALETNEKK